MSYTKFTLRLSKEQNDLANEISKELNISKHQFIVNLIEGHKLKTEKENLLRDKMFIQLDEHTADLHSIKNLLTSLLERS